MRAVLQLVLETPGTLQLSMDPLGTGKVPLVPHGPLVLKAQALSA